MSKNRKKVVAVLILGASLGISACAHQMLKPAPRAGKPIAVVYTGKGLSAMSDLPPGTYRVPDSDVIVSGHQKASTSPAAMMFGVVGVLVANQIDKNGGKTAVKSAADYLHLKLSPDADTDLKGLLASEEFRDYFTTTGTRANPLLEIGGSVVMTFVDDTQVLPYVVLYASLKQYPRNPELKDPTTVWSTRYMSSIGMPRSFAGPGGWTENDASVLKATVAAELKQAMEYLLRDVKDPAPRDDARRLLVTGHFPLVHGRFQIVSYGLGEEGNSIVFAPDLSDLTVLAGVVMVDKSQVSVRPFQKGDRSKKVDDGTAH